MKAKNQWLGSSIRHRRSTVWNKVGFKIYGSHSNWSTFQHHVKGWHSSHKKIHVGFFPTIKEFVVSFSASKFKLLDPSQSISMAGTVVSTTFVSEACHYVSKSIWFSAKSDVIFSSFICAGSSFIDMIGRWRNQI